MGIRTNTNIRIKSRSGASTPVENAHPVDNALVAQLRRAVKPGYQQLPLPAKSLKNKLLKTVEKILAERPDAQEFYYRFRRCLSLYEHLTPEISYSLVYRNESSTRQPLGFRLEFHDNHRNAVILDMDFSDDRSNKGFMMVTNNDAASFDALLAAVNDVTSYNKIGLLERKYDFTAAKESYRNSIDALVVEEYNSENPALLERQLAEFGNCSPAEAFLELEFSTASNYNVYHMSNFYENDDDEDSYEYEQMEDDLTAEISFFDDAWREHNRIFRFTEEQCRHAVEQLYYRVESFYQKPAVLSEKDFYEKWPGLSSKDFTHDFSKYSKNDLGRFMGAMILKQFKRDIPRREVNKYTQDPDFKKHLTIR